MRRKTFMMLIFFLISASFFASPALALPVDLDNYHYVHSNTVGDRQLLKNKSGQTVIHGDARENDATIHSMTLEMKGLQPGEKVYLIYPDGSTQDVTVGSNERVYLNKVTKSISIALKKTTTKETLVRVKTVITDDASAPEFVTYYYLRNTPTNYGDLGDGSGTGGGDVGVCGVAPGNIDLLWNNGTRRITWTTYPEGTYEIIVTTPEGTKSSVVPSTKVYRPADAGGTYKFELKTLDGCTLLTREMNVPAATDPDPDPEPEPNPDPPDESDPGSNPGPCTKDGCDFINEILTCPGWDAVMGDLTIAIRDALHPPPDWWMVSDLIGEATLRHLSGYLGDVPDPPTKEEIDWATYTTTPTLDKTVEMIEPIVPDEYNRGKIVFELNNGPEINIRDESRPFEINDPLSNLKSDEVGRPVLPGDPRNESDGIKRPDRLDLGGPPQPRQEPSPTPTPGPIPETNPSSPPIPSDSGGGTAMPDATEGVIPIPEDRGG